MPFFSIIMPLYNCDSTLQQALNSIHSQHFNDYELILVDGGSNDNTQYIISNYKKTSDTNILFISEPDKGMYDAMNKGIDMATGQWLYFMAGNNVFSADEILTQVYQAIQSQTADIIYGNATGELSNTGSAADTNKVLSNNINYRSIFYKRGVFNYTGKFNIRFKVAADYHLTLKAFFNPAFKTKYIDLDIIRFDKASLHASAYDYCFYSYHYRFLSTHKALSYINDKAICLQQSIYCCLWLVKEKQSVTFAWLNMLYYLTGTNKLNMPFRFKTFFNMAYRSIMPKS